MTADLRGKEALAGVPRAEAVVTGNLTSIAQKEAVLQMAANDLLA